MTITGYDDEWFRGRVHHPQFPRSAGYGERWQFERAMGPNPLWLVESISHLLDLRPGMRVLDLGCGRAATSVFLSREFGVRVTAADLWIEPDENWRHIQADGMADLVTPIKLEAHAIPFAEGYFDAIVSFDAYHYFGTDQLYLQYVTRFLRTGGQLAIVVPGVTRELDDVPAGYAQCWQRDMFTFHTPQWWRRLWTVSGLVDVEHAELLPDGFDHFLRWEELEAAAHLNPQFRDFSTAFSAGMREDPERILGFAQVVARKH